MATLQNLMDDTRTRLADLEDLSYTDGMLTTFANEGAKKMAESLCCQFNSNITGKTGGYIAFADFPKEPLLITLVKVGNVKLAMTPFNESGSWESTNTITAYTVWDQFIRFDGVLIESDIVSPNSIYTPDTLASNGDVSDIPDRYIYGVVSWMEYRCRALDREGGLTERAYNEYVEAKAFAAAINQSNIYTGGYAK